MAGPLAGLKVIDFTSLLPGPYATMFLADLGAEVLQVTSQARPDPVDFLPPFIGNTPLSAARAYLGRGKRSLFLNLKHPQAPAAVKRLMRIYDILIEQFRPGVMARLGLDYANLREANRGLIYCSLTGYGQTGPLAQRAGHDINYLARSGLMAYSGRKDTGPTLMGMQVADLTAGSLLAIIGILAAVRHREKTGEGQYVDVAMTDGLLSFHALAGAAFLAGGEEAKREETILNGGSLYDFYETADGKHLSFGALEQNFFSACCAALGRDDLIPQGVVPPEVRQKKEEIRALIKTKTRDQWEEIFKGIDGCVEPVLSLREALDDPQTKTREMIVEVELPDGQKVSQIACPLKFSLTPPIFRQAGVPPGTHTREVLLEAGFTEEEIAGGEETGLFR